MNESMNHEEQTVSKDTSRMIGVAVGVLVLIGVVFLLFNFKKHSQVSQGNEPTFTLPGPLLSKDTVDYSSFQELPTLNWNPNRGILIEDLQVEPEAVSTTSGELPEPLPWFYFSPNVAKVSPTSMANEYQLLEREPFNDYAWYTKAGERYLFKDGEPYNGWYHTRFGALRHYQDGAFDGMYISHENLPRFQARRERLQTMVPQVRPKFFFIEQSGEGQVTAKPEPVSYPVLYKNPERIILSTPPGMEGMTLVDTTETYADMPMEIVEEVTVDETAWVHAYIGYEELGWLPKDDTFTDYVQTYYSERELLDTIEAIAWEEIEQIAARVGVSFINNETMAQVDVNNQAFFPASTQKIFVLGELYHQYSTGELSPDTEVILTNADKVPGAGIIQEHADGTVFTLDELVNLVAIYSDNTAANMLIDAVGGGEVINPSMQGHGFYDTEVTGKYYHDGTWFSTTPHDAARFFALLHNNELNGEPWDELLIEKFQMNTHTFLRTNIWGDTYSWNKSGLGGTEQNDVATFVTPYGSYSLAVYTAEPAYYGAIPAQVAQLSSRIHEAFNTVRSNLWLTVE